MNQAYQTAATASSAARARSGRVSISRAGGWELIRASGLVTLLTADGPGPLGGGAFYLLLSISRMVGRETNGRAPPR